MKTEEKRYEGFDIIGDIHGRAAELKMLLNRLGYTEHYGCFRHPRRQAAFVGDFVDRGPDVGGALQIVKRMTDEGAAQAVIGNHDYNLLCWYKPHPIEEGKFLRDRTNEKYRKQQARSIEFFDAKPELQELYFGWLLDLPLILDLGGARVIHACWNEKKMAGLNGARTLTEVGFGSFERKQNTKGDALAILLCGHEMTLPGEIRREDNKGCVRNEMRVKWWLNQPGATLADLALSMSDPVPGSPVAANEIAKLPGYADSAPPLFIGHYGFRSPPGLMRHNIACVDYASPGGSPIGAYRWDGEQILSEKKFI